MEQRPCVEQATCEECDRQEFEHIGRVMTVGAEPDIVHDVRCACGETATITVAEEGLETEGPISYEDASWNQTEAETNRSS